MMKSIKEMTVAEMEAARKSGAKTYGTTMYRPSRVNRGERVYSDIEDYCPFACRKTIADLVAQGWRELPDNRYIRAGLHPEAACNAADVMLTALASGQPPLV